MAQAIPFRQASPLKASCHQCSLSNLCLPLAIEENDLDRLEDIVQQGRIFNRGEHIFDQSTPYRSCFAVKSGSIKTSIITESGEEQVTGFFMPGELVGWIALAVNTMRAPPKLWNGPACVSFRSTNWRN